MRHAGIPGAILLLTLSAFAPAMAGGDDKGDLEATMTVLEDPADLDAAIRRMDRPDDSAVDDEGRASGDKAPDDDGAADKVDDEFEYDEDDNEDDLENEDDFEEGEDVDEDEFDG